MEWALLRVFPPVALLLAHCPGLGLLAPLLSRGLAMMANSPQREEVRDAVA